MDYKQKYENALERCKKEFNFNNLAYSHEEIKQRLERVFPELKESEDERIRKEIIQSIQDNMCIIHKDKCIAWLEKKGHTDSIIEKAKTEKQRIIITETDGNTNIDWDTRSLEDARELLECGLQYINTELEKQGEQKPTDEIKPKFKVGDTIVEKDPDECDYETIKDIKNGQYIFTDGYCMNINEQEGWQLVKTPTIIEQKPTWSEEDEIRAAQIISDLEKCTVPGFPVYIGGVELEINWLKSLKERMKGE